MHRRAARWALLGLLGGALAVVPATSPTVAADAEPVCGSGWLLTVSGQPPACAHADAAPRGVDVTKEVTTSALRLRQGAGARAYAAAASLGTPGAYGDGEGGSAVTCDGDGTSGPRVQAMYVVETGRENRYQALLPSLQRWAAGVDDVLNRSAALTGGARSVRYVTQETGDGSCVAKVLNVTVPAGASASIGTTIEAVKALGFANPARKYLMWTDATRLCGIASMYPDENPAQTNRNNGSYPQYARIDSGCWGFGNGGSQHSVEAHELVHTLGAVQNLAPHSTRAGHCWDEADTMCYADGGSHAMVSVCSAEQEYLLDCEADDYFSTYPEDDSYLATHWNSADNQFLLGGGDGVEGGDLGTPQVLGGELAVNNPAIPGLPTQASVTVELPEGRELVGATWKAGRGDCAVEAPDAEEDEASLPEQVEVTCPASLLTTTTLSVTLTDSTGATKTLTSPLTFAKPSTPRPVSLAVSVDGGSEDVTVCTGFAAQTRAWAYDEETGLPIRGLAVSLTKRVGDVTTTAAAKATDGEGLAKGPLSTTVAALFGATARAQTAFAAATAEPVVVTPEKCEATLEADELADTEPWYGAPVTLSGTLTRDAGDEEGTAVAGAQVVLTVRNPETGKVVRLATPVTDADGAWTATVKATASGHVVATQLPSASFVGTSTEVGDLDVQVASTELDGEKDTEDSAYGNPVRVTGSLSRVTDEAAPLPGAVVQLRLTPSSGAAVTVGSATVTKAGTFVASFAAKASGSLAAVYAGAAGQTGTTLELGDLEVTPWTSAVTLTSLTAVSTTVATRVSGTATRTWGQTTQPLKSTKVALVLTPAGDGVPRVLTTVTTSSTGTFSALISPKAAGGVRAVITASAALTESRSDRLAVGS